MAGYGVSDFGPAALRPVWHCRRPRHRGSEFRRRFQPHTGGDGHRVQHHHSRTIGGRMAAPDTPPGVDRDSWQITFLDILLILVVVLLPLVTPPTAAEQLRPPGSLVVETIWPPECHTDVDLWVQGPVGRAVGYSNQSDMLFNLLRDDLGHQGDLSDLNYENAYTRGLPDGEYIVNLHLYTHRGGCELAVDRKSVV